MREYICGAGVAQDRTGLSWSVLNQELAIESKDRARKYIESILNAKCDDELFQKREDILEEFYLSDNMISKVLYRGSGWSRGRFFDSIVELCCYLASSGKSVNILTTNYDDYIETALTKRIRRSYEDAVSKVSKNTWLDYDVSIMMDRAGEQSIYSPAKNVLPRIGTSL